MLQGSFCWGYVDIATRFAGEVTQKPQKFGLQMGPSSQIGNVE
jgi:hypothetical protein